MVRSPHQSIGQQMWSPPGLNVESYVEPLPSPRSEVVTHMPRRPLVHLFEISGSVRSFFSNLCLFSGCFVACRGAMGGSWVRWEVWGCRYWFSGRANADSKGFTVGAGCGLRV